MDFTEIITKAKKVRDKYSELEARQGIKKWGATERMQGFVGDVGDLMKLVMAKNNLRKIENVDQKIAHELSDCLYSVLILADELGVNLEEEFVQTMETLEQKIEKELKG